MLPLHTLEAVNASVNTRFQHCAAWSCTTDFRPALKGDCKQAAAMKLRDLILAGAHPDEFVIWVVRVPGGLHAVVVQRESGLVLDSIPQGTNCSAYGCAHAYLVEPAWVKFRFEAMTFRAACAECGGAARLSAAIAARNRR